MRVYFGQIYVEPGVKFPFTHLAQLALGEAVTSHVAPSEKFIKKYGERYSIVFRISAKRLLTENELRGPTAYRKTEDVEFTIFLPFDVITKESDAIAAALEYIFRGVYAVLESLQIDTTLLRSEAGSIMSRIRSDSAMVG